MKGDPRAGYRSPLPSPATEPLVDPSFANTARFLLKVAVSHLDHPASPNLGRHTRAEKLFDVLPGTDKGIPHRQDVSRFDPAVILLRARSDAREGLAPPMDGVDVKLASVAPGTVVGVPSDRATGRWPAGTQKRPETVPDNRPDVIRFG